MTAAPRESGDAVAIVTGAARGIGAATAKRLAAAGVSVAVVDRTESDTDGTVAAVRAVGGRAVGVGCDVAEADQVLAAVDEVVRVFGHVDVLVNCAGVNQDRLLLTMSDDEWDTVVDVNLGGTVRCSLAVAPHMKQCGYGRIINFGSVAAEGNAGQANYAAAKAAIAGLTRTLAAEFGPYGITVNAVAPGFVVTSMVDDLARRLGRDKEAFLGDAAAQAAVGRVGAPDDIAAVVAFLASAESEYLSGQTIYVDGGAR
jgi:novobiocin biosynthesis protein NovJ